MKPAVLIWFRLDLRLADNPALEAAGRHGGAVVPVFIWSPDEEGEWPPGAASRWWLHQSLAALDGDLRARGSRLVIRRGPALEILRALVKETGARAVFWNRRYEPAVIARDATVREALRGDGVEVESFNAALLHEPWTIQNKSGKPFQVFTPFWKRCLDQADPAQPLPAPGNLPASAKWPKSLTLAELELEPKINWADGMCAAWQPGEAGALKNLKHFLGNAFGDYSERRDRPDIVGTSRLSPHLHFGEVSPRQIWHAVRRHAGLRGVKTWRTSQFLAEVGWREFAHHLLFHFPRTAAEPLRPEFKRFPWQHNSNRFRAWQKGRTGFPIVDAGMRELWATGWMHNRVRMIVASFLVKDLLLPWQEGAKWFWDTLVDADLAQNTLGWQWTAGCGADAAPYFRVFNPVCQGEKFDPHGDYTRCWCPELAKLPAKWIHQPDQTPPEILRTAGLILGKDYPRPIVRHPFARQVALEAFARLKGGGPYTQP
jgi:deoxyribodipyrimidine photo-lyase